MKWWLPVGIWKKHMVWGKMQFPVPRVCCGIQIQNSLSRSLDVTSQCHTRILYVFCAAMQRWAVRCIVSSAHFPQNTGSILGFLLLRSSRSALGSLSSVAVRAQIRTYIYRHQDTLKWRVVRTSAWCYCAISGSTVIGPLGSGVCCL